jgi:hypothetical protein
VVNPAFKSTLEPYFRMRLRQMERQVFALGSYAVLIAFALLTFWIYSFFLQQKANMVMWFCGLSALGVISWHLNRKDLRFLESNIPAYHLLLSVEYLLFLLPFVLTSFVGGFAYYWLPSIALAFLLPWYQPRNEQMAMNKWLWFIPLSLFEWRSGMRKMYVPLVFLYLASWVAVGLPYLSLFLLWLLSVLAIGFYDHNEDLAVLTDSATTAHTFLKEKLISHLKWVLFWFMPVVVVHLIFHWQNVFVVLLILAGLVMLWVFSITAKYSHYAPAYTYFKQSNFTAVIAILSILPIGFIFPAGYALFYYFKAIRNLKPYFND